VPYELWPPLTRFDLERHCSRNSQRSVPGRGRPRRRLGLRHRGTAYVRCGMPRYVVRVTTAGGGLRDRRVV